MAVPTGAEVAGKVSVTFYRYVGDVNGEVDVFGLANITVYHYTDRKGYNGISGSGVIMQSDPSARGKGSIKGKPKGVYVTKIGPEDIGVAKNGTGLGKVGLTNSKAEFYGSSPFCVGQ